MNKNILRKKKYKLFVAHINLPVVCWDVAISDTSAIAYSQGNHHQPAAFDKL